ncbi:MAG: segregation/condensation protein A [Candidatus Micrarchaeota archaeon]|nr:segregation/condensation protein A [Candidatus Micrarchaeota archaeon]MDE1864173.1 segregation/condensation protein A [Candidatus Micrarchaeota archaeon]
MATAQSVEVEAVIDPGNVNLEQLVSDATWKEVLIDLVRKEKFDPWNIGIVEVVDRYIAVIKSMKVMDLRVPANIILAAAILLRLKSEMLSMEEQQVDEETAVIEERPNIIVDPLSLRLRLAPKRKVSLDELIGALEEAMKLKEMRESKVSSEPLALPIEINPVDIEAEIENVYQMAKKNVDKSNMTTFSAISVGMGLEEALLSVFIPLLFLSHKKRLALIQERFFDEIIIVL